MRVSVIVPVLNEREAIGPLIEALSAQTRRPDQILVADGGSTDGTKEVVEQLSRQHPELALVEGPGSIAANRNAAIRVATGEVIACTDAGCFPEPQWLEALTEPFEHGAEWVAGFYRPDGHTTASTAAGVVMMTVREDVDMDHFLPGGSSQAFVKSAWQRVGGFPEGLNAGEDTLFGEQLRAVGYRPVFAPEAVVSWHPPKTLREMAAKSRRWGEADGVNRVRTGAYLKVIIAYWFLPLLALVVAIWNPWVALTVLAGIVGLVAYRTRHKFKWVPGSGKWVMVPVAHLRQQLAQSLGWVKGFGVGNLVRKISERGLRPVRRWLPESLNRSLEERRAIRHNVDVVTADASQAVRWLEALPDTYRMKSDRANGDPVVLASIQPRRGTEPVVSPVAVDLPPDIEREIAADPTMLADPVAAYSLLRQTGHRFQLIPAPGGLTARLDKLTGTGSIVVLAAVPLRDVGGGSRGAQIAQEAVSRGFHVTYVYRFDTVETVDLGLRFIHPHLEEIALEDFNVKSYQDRLPSGPKLIVPKLLVVEFPHHDYKPVVEKLVAVGFTIVYDMIDDWTDDTLGAWWYQQDFADWLIARAGLLTASAPSLVRTLQSQTGLEVLEVPNGVNAAVFRNSGDLPKPHDLPTGDGPVIEYHGSLYGHWFDWDSVSRVARAFPHARVVLIGDPPPPVADLPANVHLLGLKPQGELAAYLSHTDVGLVPFVVSQTTHAVSPLKVFEYLAMGVPVAAPPLEPVKGLDGVYTNSDLVAAVKAALEAPRPDPGRALAEHGWGERLGRMLGALDIALPPIEREVRVERRPVRHYGREERLLS